MWRGLARACACMLALLAAGCAAADLRARERRETQTRNIVDDAIAYNEAYSGAINGQILLNILRAYNRQPRQYMSMSGFSNASPGVRSGSVSVGGVPLDRLGEAWGEGGFDISAARRLAPDYTVQPFDSDAFSTIALEPTSPVVFQHYWYSGWNRDVLLLVLVDAMEIVSADGAREILSNSAGTIDNDCEGAQYDFGGCRFVRATRVLADATRAPMTPLTQHEECMPIAAYGDVARAPRAAPLSHCPVMLLVGDKRYTLLLRSLDSMVYYVGELLRRNELASGGAEADVLAARVGVIGPGYYRPQDRVPLFRIVRDGEARDFAATVSYAGRRFSAGAPMNRFCYDPPPGERCRDGAVRGDRSGTVLELLASVLAYNQSEAAVSAPESAIINAR